MSELIIAHSTVILHINLKLTDGSVADSTRMNHKPAKIVLGSGDVTPAFESELIGLKKGDKKTFTLAPQDAFGYPNPANFHKMSKTRFDKSIKLEKDNIVEFEQLSGSPLLGIIREVGEDDVLVDLNHPLCGQSVVFEVEIIGVE